MRIQIVIALMLASLVSLVGCSGAPKVAKEEQARYMDRNPAHIHAPPANFRGGPPGGAAPGGPPKGAMPPSTKG